MFTLFLIVTAATVSLMWARWDTVRGLSLGLTGAASIALGVRVMALASALYFWPALAQSLWSDEAGVPSVVAEGEKASAESPKSDSKEQEQDQQKAPAAAVVEKPGASPAGESAVPAAPAQPPSAPQAAAVPAEAEALPAEASEASPPAATPAEAPPADPRSVVLPESAGSSSAVTDQPAGSSGETPAAAPSDGATTFEKTRTREPIKIVTNVVYLAEDRPEWLEALPKYDDGVLKVAVKAGPYFTARDCEPDLEREVNLAVADFVNQRAQAKHASNFIHFSLDELRRRDVVREQFSEQLETSLGLMNQVHAQLAFDDAFAKEVDLRWSEIRSKSRLAQVGMGAGIIVLMLGTLFSYFRLDTATKGYYTGRLQFGTAGAILALVAASVLLAKLIPWM
jgi:hypothetical protein